MKRLIDVEECFAKGMLRKTLPSKEQALMSLGKAASALEDAKANFAEKRFDATIILAYMSLLCASKAVLFNDGVREKSHICIARYLESAHRDIFDSKSIRLFDSFREERHEVQYSASFRASELQAKEILDFAGAFLEKAEKVVGK
ncbi:MAG: HEPN domain-containing protein [Candidatus Micrarchaeota archaeon]